MNIDKVVHEPNPYTTSGVENQPGAVYGKYQTEKDLIDTIIKREGKYSAEYQKLFDIANTNKAWYIGEQSNPDKDLAGSNNPVVNRIFPSIETIIPMVTERIPEPVITVSPKNRKNTRLGNKLTAKLKYSWQKECKMAVKMERAIRNWATNRYAVLKFHFDEDTQDYQIKVLPAGKVFFDTKTDQDSELPCLGEYVETTIGEAREKFPEAKEIFENILRVSPEKSDDSTFTYIEYWERDFVTAVMKPQNGGEGKILGYEKNPFFNWEEPEFNHFKKAKIPYMFINVFNWGDSYTDPISLVELVRSLQENINDRKEQIDKNAKMSNGQYVFAGNKISEGAADAVSSDPEEKIYLDKADTVEGAYKKEYGRGLDASIFNDMVHSENEIDNVLGTHSVSRGENDVNNDTFRGKALLASKDTSRQRTIIRSLENVAEQIYDFMIQCMFVFYDEKHTVPMKAEYNLQGEYKEEECISKKDLVKAKIKLEVLEGSLMPKDKEALKLRAQELMVAGKMSLLDYYKITEWENPEKLARNAIMEIVNPMYLYAEVAQGDNIDIQAIRNIKKILGSKIPMILSGELKFLDKDPMIMKRYTDTIRMYMKGEELDDDLIPYSSLQDEWKAGISNHLELQSLMTEEAAKIVYQQNPMQGGQPSMQPQVSPAPMGQPMGQQPMSPDTVAGAVQGLA